MLEDGEKKRPGGSLIGGTRKGESTSIGELGITRGTGGADITMKKERARVEKKGSDPTARYVHPAQKCGRTLSLKKSLPRKEKNNSVAGKEEKQGGKRTGEK